MRSVCILVIIGTMTGPVAAEEPARPAVARQSPHHLDLQSPQQLQELFRYTGATLPLVSAHRGGAAAGLPENCLATFAETLNHTYALLEIDPRITSDGAIVVHHDTTLDRTTTGTGPVNEQTLAQLRKLQLKDPAGNVTEHRIPTLDEVLQWARGKTVLVLDQKDVSVEARVRAIEENDAESYAMLIVYSDEDARTCYRLNPDIMMEVMIPDRSRLRAFEATGIPWSNIVAFVGHSPPEDRQLLEMIHARGASCFVGTSRNLDRAFATRHRDEPAELEQDYRHLLQFGADVIETDLPREVGQLLFNATNVPASRSPFFK